MYRGIIVMMSILKNIFMLILFLSTILFANLQKDDIQKSGNELSQSKLINLSKEEKDWILNNKIKLGVKNSTPLIFSNSGNDIDGIVGDIFKLIMDRTGLQVEIINDSWDSLLTDLKNKKIDLLPATYYIKQRLQYGLYTKAYFTMLNYIYVKDENNTINSINDLNGKTLAIIKNHETIPQIKNKFPKIKIIETENLNDSINRVLKNEVDALYEAQIVVEHKLKEELISKIKAIKQDFFKFSMIHMLVRDDMPILRTILQKGLDSISLNEIESIKTRWMSINSETFFEDDGKNLLTNSYFNLISLSKLLLSFIVLVIIFYIFYKLSVLKLLNTKFVTFSRVVVFFEIFIVILLLYSITILDRRENILAKMHENRFLMMQAALNLRQSSDDLTHFARSYAVTGDVKFKKQFESTLGIRDGMLKRPSRYYGIYWDLKETDRIKRHPLTKKLALKDIIKKLPFTKEELNKLKESEDNSNELVNLEIEAFNALEKGDKQFAINLLHSKAYYAAKHKIMLPIDDFIIMFNKRLKEELKVLESSIINQFYNIFILLLIFIFGNLFLYLLLRKKVNTPIEYLINTIHKIKKNQVVEKETFFNDEIGETIEEFFIMHNEIEEQQNSLKESRKRFLTLFDASPDSIAIIKDGEYVDCNKKTLELFGAKSVEEFISIKKPKYFFQSVDLFSGEMAEKSVLNTIEVEDYKEEGDYRFEWVHKRIDNKETFSTEVILSSIKLNNEDHIYEVIRDISGRKELEKQILENQEQMTFVSQYANFGFWNFNPQIGDFHVNNVFIQMLGYKSSDIIEKDSENRMFKSLSRGVEFLQEIIHPDDLETTTRALNAHIYGQTELFKTEYRMKKSDGTWLWTLSIGHIAQYDIDDKPIKFNGVNIDIQESKEAQEQISKNKLFVDNLLNSQEQIVITTNNGKIKSCNKAFLDFFEIKSMEEFTKDYDCICDKFEEDDSGNYLQKYMDDLLWIEYILKGETVSNKVILTKNGKNRIFTVTAAYLPIESGLKSAVFTDITELESQKEQTESILSSLLLPMLITSKVSSKIVYANSFAEQQYETNINELIGMTIDKLYTYSGQKEEILQELKTKGILQNFETRFRTLKGNEFDAILSLIDINFAGEECYLGVASDITEQKNREVLIQKLHKNVTDSIEYASLIQHSLIPSNELFDKYFDDYFTFWSPKDIVGGDIYLFEELRDDDECLLMLIDCTGHGVPGAFVTMFVKAIERQIVTSIINNPTIIVSPAWILKHFNQTMKKLLKQENIESISNAGFDGAVLYYNRKEQIIKYAGAEVPLFYMQEGRLEMIRGSRHSVGYKKSDINYEFKEHILKAKKGLQLYLATDGYLDQNGGKKGFPLGRKRFKTIIENKGDKSFNEQKNALVSELKSYQNNEERNDDITIVGIRI